MPMQISSSPLPADLSKLLPAPTVPATDPLDITALLASQAERLGHWPGERLGRQRHWALIVEPHRKVAELIAYLLDFELGIQTVSLPGPRLITSLLRRWTPDLVLAEIPPGIHAPSVEDLESLRPLLEVTQAQSAPLPVILCTTYMEVTSAMARSAGFAGLIYKPFLPSTLVATVRAVMARVPESRTG
jgi:DNA-binding NarL/FixJ family response regulator